MKSTERGRMLKMARIWVKKIKILLKIAIYLLFISIGLIFALFFSFENYLKNGFLLAFLTIFWIVLYLGMAGLLGYMFFSLLYDWILLTKVNFNSSKKFFAITITIFVLIYFIPLLFARICSENQKILIFKRILYTDYVAILIGCFSVGGIFSFFFTDKNYKLFQENDTQNGDTTKKIRGFCIVDNNLFSDGKKFKIDLNRHILLIANYLGNHSGNNLWLPMNKWYEKHKNEYSNYPLFNAMVNNWQGNDEWYEQLNNFINYLESNDLLAKD